MIDLENLPIEIENLFNALNKAEFTVFEESIDMNVHFEYMEYVTSLDRKSKKSKAKVLKRMNEIFDENVPNDEKKELLARLAAVTEVEAFRTIERFVKEDNRDLHDWAVVALQESRMLLESDLLDEPKVHISTGMGGKGNKLRFITIVCKKDKTDLSDLQKKIITNEFTFMLEGNDSEIENITFHTYFAYLKVLIPIKTNFRTVLTSALEACNVFGSFLSDEIIATNVKELTLPEIENLLSERSYTQRF